MTSKSNQNACADFPNVVVQPHIFEKCAHRGLWPPNWNSAEILYRAPTPKFHHPVFTRSEVIVLTNKQTNKQTPLKTSNALRYATTLGNQRSSSHRQHFLMRTIPTIDLSSVKSTQGSVSPKSNYFDGSVTHIPEVYTCSCINFWWVVFFQFVCGRSDLSYGRTHARARHGRARVKTICCSDVWPGGVQCKHPNAIISRSQVCWSTLIIKSSGARNFHVGSCSSLRNGSPQSGVQCSAVECI